MSYLKAELDEILALDTRRISLEETYRGLALHELHPAPAIAWDAATLAACEAAYDRFIATGAIEVPRDELEVPPWVFLEYLVERRGHLLHGSGETNLDRIEPRTARDNIEDGDRAKIHATTSSMMALFYATLDRPRMMQIPCVPALHAQQVERDGMPDGLWFVVDWRALPFQPWRSGMVYVLPRAPFRDEHRLMQWSTADAVAPVARLAVTPDDFPMRRQVYGFDFMEQHRREHAGIDGWPWRNDPAMYPDPRYRPPPLP